MNRSRLVSAAIGHAIAEGEQHLRLNLSEHHAFGETAEVSGEYAEDLAANHCSPTNARHRVSILTGAWQEAGTRIYKASGRKFIQHEPIPAKSAEKGFNWTARWNQQSIAAASLSSEKTPASIFFIFLQTIRRPKAPARLPWVWGGLRSRGARITIPFSRGCPVPASSGRTGKKRLFPRAKERKKTKKKKYLPGPHICLTQVFFLK